MIQPVTKINWQQWDDAVPAFLAMVMIPFTYSISQGIIWGFLCWTLLKLAGGKRNEVSATLFIIDAFCITALIIE
jgi:AGZA family xanthine/uracil permease-like MFS transporter